MKRLGAAITTRARALVVLVAVALAASPAVAQNERIRPATLNVETIKKAVDAGIKALYEREPNYVFGPARSNVANRNRRSRNKIGYHALASWALLDVGESYQNPPLYKRINWVLSSDVGRTFDRGMRAQMLAELPYVRWRPWVHRDFIWLKNALHENGNYAQTWFGDRARGPGDHASGQYGVLGLWGIERAGKSLPREIWKRIDSYWRKSQQDAGDGTAGWSLSPDGGSISGPMTAGGVAVLMVTERKLYGDEFLKGGVNVTPELRKGIAWLDQNFSISDSAEARDWYYYMWAMMRVGRATGFRTFNGLDWFREVTARMLNKQKAGGHWTGPKGPVLSTAFALLYMGRAREPVAVAKARFPTSGEGADNGGDGGEGNGNAGGAGRWGDWNRYPHDMWNFVDYISDQYEYGMGWHIMDVSQPPYALMEAPLLYMSTGKALQLTDKQKENLRRFARAGGLIVCNPDDQNAKAVRSMEDLAQDLFGREMEKVPQSHELYNLHQHLGAKVPMKMVSNGIRPLMVCFVRDMGPGLQRNNPLRASGFSALSNLYLYATGKNFRRGRLETPYVVESAESPRTTLKAARVKHGGNHNPEPAALQQLGAMLANRHDIELTVETVAPRELADHDIAFLTSIGDGSLSGAQARSMRKWAAEGGTIWIDAAGGGQDAVERSRKMLEQIVPNQAATPVSRSHSLVDMRDEGGYDVRRAGYRLYSLHTRGAMENPRPRLEVVSLRGRPAIVYSAEDLTAGLAGARHWGIDGYDIKTARQIVLNGSLLVSEWN